MKREMVPSKQVSGKWLLVLSVGAIIISLAFVGVAYVALSPAQGGTLFGAPLHQRGRVLQLHSGRDRILQRDADRA